MSIKYLIQRYPWTIFTILLILTGICSLFIEARVFAASEKANTPGCSCASQLCITLTNCYNGICL
jgi:hypothetical protein